MVARFVRHCTSAITLNVVDMHHFKTLMIILLAIAAWVAMVMAVGVTVLIVSPLLRLARFFKAGRGARNRSTLRGPFRDQESTQY